MSQLNWEITSPLPPYLLGDEEPESDAVDDDPPAGSMMLVVKRGPNAGARFHLDRPTVAAGRHPNSDIFLDDVTASRRHAEFVRDGDDVRLVDSGSLNGTYLNRMPVTSAVLRHGDVIHIGKFRLMFLRGAAPA